MLFHSLHCLHSQVKPFRESSGKLSKTEWNQEVFCPCRVRGRCSCLNLQILWLSKAHAKKKKKKKLLHHLATWWKTSLNWTFQKFTIEFHLSDLGSEWEKGWKGWWRVRVEENFFFFLVRRNRLHSWILCHVINKTKHTAFLPKHMALFLKHRSGLSWNSVFVSILFFLFT